MSQMLFWSLSWYICPWMKMEVTFWPRYGRRMVSPRVRWSAGTTSSSSIIHRPSACTSHRGFMYLYVHAVRIIHKSFLVFLVRTSIRQLCCWAKSSLRFFSQKSAQLFPCLPGSPQLWVWKGAGAASKPANLRRTQAASGWRRVAAALAAPAAPVTMALETFSRLLHIPRKKCSGQTPSFAEIWHDRLLHRWPVLPPISPQRG